MRHGASLSKGETHHSFIVRRDMQSNIFPFVELEEMIQHTSSNATSLPARPNSKICDVHLLGIGKQGDPNDEI